MPTPDEYGLELSRSFFEGAGEESADRDSAKFVSDEGMQLIWGRILAGEFENPGSTPPSTMRVLAEITPKYAKAFQALCSLEVQFEALGLIRFDGTAEFCFTFLNADAHTEIRISYAKDSCVAERYQEDLFPCGVIILTQAGGAIASFTETISAPEHFSHVVEYLKGHNVVMKSTAL